ncbi:hypothetical protein HRbin36_00754 [bacterium HR36]|nr:hypothetical protein HRbin36_00754 [bacterium HR36]
MLMAYHPIYGCGQAGGRAAAPAPLAAPPFPRSLGLYVGMLRLTREGHTLSADSKSHPTFGKRTYHCLSALLILSARFPQHQILHGCQRRFVFVQDTIHFHAYRHIQTQLRGAIINGSAGPDAFRSLLHFG